MKKTMTYRDAGVDINKGNEAVDKIKPLVARTKRPEVLGGLGGFGGLFQVPQGYENPVLVSGTDGIGTKLKVAFMCGKHDTIGIDAVAMCVNDILVAGAEPLFFLDYVAVGQLDPDQLAEVVAGIAEGCVQAGCALIGGETAEMPGFYQTGEYDVAGFSVGIVEKEALLDGSAVKEGDLILGLPSTGLHSNGYSLARKIAFDRAGKTAEDYIEPLGETLGEALLRPTRIYIKDVLPILKDQPGVIHAMAHITGGGLVENVPRVLPEGLSAEIKVDAWPRLPIFDWLAAEGQVPEDDMWRTFNMGIGLAVVVAAEEAAQVKADFDGRGVRYYEIGRVVAGDQSVVLV
ncbi:phosphoribosylformylglycinamidine cyclo-ligase [Peptococcus simiae]|uniref:phosphoribosylformylglycinamidine cyclo-ligase n=1 Tax=Peptococcus simiae TaxID=1643805 RepID=UPI0039815825